MQGKVKSIFVHIINAIAIGGLGFFGLELISNLFHGKEVKDANIYASILCFVVCAVFLVAEIILIVYQAKHKYGKAVLISGLIAYSLLIVAPVLFCVLLTVKGKNVPGIAYVLVGAVALIGAAGILLYVFINKNNKGVVVVAPVKAVEAKKEEVVEEKLEVVEKAPVVAKKKPVAVAKKPAAAKKPTAVKKAPAKKAAAKKPTAKKPVAKKKPATKKKK